MYKQFFKPLIDILFSIIIILILLPVIIVITIILFFVNKGKPFFFQERPGLNEKSFKLIKFKSMTDMKDNDGNYLPDYKRITKIGYFLRNSSLDELPQLFNVIKGDLSIIGPRPLRMEYLQLYNEKEKKRHNVKPGITGWAQVNGRNSITWKQKFEHDIYYVDNISFFLDIKILLLTIKKVLRKDDINKDSTLTMEPFNGSN